ncbi:methyltransferase [Spongiactinospora sp. TRM90649]|uniref:methyltransferase n=1 Tax=Spongiactinospora sp. TRM90649 TaxID=3031114 RepID=UPI0023F8A3A1|nr:methyltransferase [Spongiactinospora sp. TRM90649]MDF5756964.1 methyltransferase [Spongiactinospora sp. TRM90649]
MPRVLLALTSHGELGDTGRATGFYVPEAAHPYRVFTEAGFDVDFVSVQGGEPPRDGVKPGDEATAAFLAEHGARLAATPTTDQLNADDYQAILFVGGHGTMWDFPDSKELARFAAAIYENGGVVAGVCHGPAGLVNVRLGDGSHLVDGKLVSAFTNEEETAVGLIDKVPFALESKLIERGARFTKAANFSAHAVADRRLVTGQNPASAVRVAELVVEELRLADGSGEAPRMSAAQASAIYLLDESVGYLYAASLRAAAQIGVADHLADGPRTAAELAEATGTDADFLYRMLRLLATRQIVREEDGGRFYLTPQGDALRTDNPVSVRDAILMTSAHTHWRSAGELVTALREGGPVFDRLFGLPYYEHIKGEQSVDGVFHKGMASFSAAVDQLAVGSCDWPQEGVVVDVGGGTGGLLVQALLARPGLRGVLFDERHVLDGNRLGEVGDDSRWETVAGDFFTEVPGGGDVYALKRILHNWSDEECVRILRNCREAMAPGGRVLVIDPVIPPGNTPDASKIHDLIMMMLLTGRERTEAELSRLLEEAGLRLTRVVRTGAPVAVIEAVAR